MNKVEEFEKEVKKKFIEEPGPDEAADRRGQAADRLRCAAGHVPLHRQADARPRSVPGHLPCEPAGRRGQGIRLHHRLQGPVQEPGEAPSRTTPPARSTATTRKTSQGCSTDRLEKGTERLEEALEAVKALCEPVEPPKDTAAYLRYFCAERHGNAEQLKENEPKRLALYKLAASLVRAYANMANEMTEAGYTTPRAAAIKAEVDALREGPRTRSSCQRRLHRSEAVRAGHAPPDRHLHPGRGEREDLGLR